ncbi:MAG: efflux RND transporter permease subunit [Micromonosporaceae bacterium]
MTGLARLSLANRSLVIMVALVISGLGAYAIPSLKQQLLPSLSFPMVTVATPYPGAAPEIVEKQVTEPIENSVEGLDGVEEVTSTSSDGLSRVQVAFDYDHEADDIVADIESAVGQIKSDLPADVEPNVVAGSTDDIPVMALAVSDGSDQRELLDRLERSVVPELAGITDVRDVAVTGARDEQVIITPDRRKLAKAGLTPEAIPAALQANGISVPAGSLTRDEKTLSVEVGDQLTSLEDLEDLYLTPGAGGPGAEGPETAGRGAGGAQGGAAGARDEPVRLGSVATVKLEPEKATSITRTNGEPSLGLSVTMTGDGNAVAISHAVRDKLPDLEAALGSGSEITVIFDQAPYVERSVEDLTTEGLLGLGFAILVIMVFLLSLRSTLVTAVSIPLSVVVALIALWLGDYSLNLLTLGALTISVGRVVDDSIVVLENIKRHLGYGEERREAVLNGVREVAGAVTSSTLTTVAVFLPIALVSGIVGEMFSSFGITVTVALLASLLVSLTVIPVLAYWFLKAPKGDAAQRAAIRARAEKRELRSPLQRLYVPVLRFATRFKVLTIVIGIAVMVGTFALIPSLKTNFIDSSGQDTTQVNLTMPIGTDLATTDEAARDIEFVLGATDGVESYQVNVGSGNPMFGGLGGSGNRASVTVTVEEGTETPKVEKRLRKELGELSIPGDLTVGQQSGRQEFGGNAVEVIVQAPDTETLAKASARVEAAMADVGGLRDVSSTVEEATPRIEVDVNRKKAAAVGLTEAQISQAVSAAFRGTPLGEIAIEGRTSDIVLSSGDEPASVGEIKDLKIPTATGRQVPLSSVATVKEVDGPEQLTRIDGERSATVSAAADVNDLGAVTTEITEQLKDLDLPEGASYTIGGASADQQEAFGDLGLAMLIAIALVFMIMVATFRSFAQPLILLVSIPFAATGAIGLLLVTDTALGVPAMIGLLMLIGIVVTNAIVLIDLINQYRAQGMEIRDAVIEGGRRRLRPILMTAIATICALVPMAIGMTGSGGFISQSLAIVVIGGLVSSTPLTLLLVPALYTVVERTKQRFRRKPKHQAPPPPDPEPRQPRAFAAAR